MNTCSLFGHSPEPGWCGGTPYFRIFNIAVDGIGREHAYLEATCRYCKQNYTVGIVHLPTTRDTNPNAFGYLSRQGKIVTLVGGGGGTGPTETVITGGGGGGSGGIGNGATGGNGQ